MPLRLSRVAVATRARPELALRCLRSYGRAALSFGRKIELAVHDDASDPGLRSGLKALGAELGLPVFYAGAQQKTAFAAALEKEGAPGARFALFGDPALGGAATIGANRNSISLDNAGGAVFMTDDDAVCRVSAAPGMSEGVEDAGARSGVEYWFYPDRAKTLKACPEAAVDLLALHERAAGQTGAVVTLNGYLGDGGASSRSYLHLRGESRARLLASQESFETAARTRECCRAAKRLSVSDGAYFMGAFAGLDLSAALPPFPPLGRGEDTVFGALRWARLPGSKTAVLPYAALHDPQPARSYPEDEVVDAGLIAADVLAAGAFAKKLDFSGWRELTRARYERRVGELEALLVEFDGPAFWRLRVDQALKNWRAKLAEARWEAEDLAPGATERYVEAFAALLETWNGVWAAAQSLRRRGVTLSEPA